MLSPNIIIIWPGTDAAIPSGFVRETSLDGKYAKGAAAATNPNTTGGAANHTHTSPNHTHSFTGHGHDIVTTSNGHETSDTGEDGIERNTKNGGHTHSGTISTIPTPSISSQAVSYSSFSNDPPYLEVIFIKSQGYQAIPDDAVVYLNDTTIPTNFAQFTALNDAYAKGAVPEEDAGATGGSLTNTHTITHTHETSHDHQQGSSSPSGGSSNKNTGGDEGFRAADASHSHTINLDTVSITSGDNSSIGSQAETVEPTYRKLLAIQNTSGGAKLALKHMVALFLGTIATIPPGWKLCDGSNGTEDMRSRYAKGAATTGEIGDTGGSNSHTHAAEGHTHAIASHTHTGNVAAANGDHQARGSSFIYWSNNPNPHTLASVSSTTDTLASSNTTADSSSNEPEFRTVLYLEFDFIIGGGGLLALL